MNTIKARLSAAMLAVVLLLSGCAQGGAGLNPQSADQLNPDKPVTVTIWTYYNGTQLSSFNTLVAQFNETVGKEQGIFVESFGQGSVNDLETNVLAAAQGKVGAGEIPNIFAAYADTAYAVDQLGLAADLRPYLSEEELSRFVESYLNEGRFSGGDSIKIFPIAKSTEVFMLNQTDWEVFAAATGASYEDFSTIEGLVSTAQAYYEWTDRLTPAPNDGKAFFGRDAMANYCLIGAMQLGCEIFSLQDGKTILNFDRDVLRVLWDNYYIPYIKGYFASSGRFRSDDIKTGNILAFIGSSSGATFFPNQVIVSDTQSYPIEMEVFPCPQFSNGKPYAVQQGAGMVVTTGSEAEIYASVQFLKWFTDDERNIAFSTSSGYLPVTKSANRVDAILARQPDVSKEIEQIITAAVGTVNSHTLYTPRAFQNGTAARSILEYSMGDRARADRTVVRQRLDEGQSLSEATAEFTDSAYFESWYREIQTKLAALIG